MADEEEEVPFNLLPPEIIEKIFNFIPSKVQIQRLRKVQRYWNKIVLGIFEVILVLQTHNWRDCILCQGENLNVNMICCLLPLQIARETDFLKRMKSLTFSIHNADYSLIHLLRKCINLHTFELCDVRRFPKHFNAKDFDWNDPTTKLPALKSLKIGLCGDGCKDANCFVRSLLPFFITNELGCKLEKIVLHGNQLGQINPAHFFQDVWVAEKNDISYKSFAVFLVRNNRGTLEELIIEGEPIEIQIDETIATITPRTRITFDYCLVTGIEQEWDQSYYSWWPVLAILKTLDYIDVSGVRSSLKSSVQKAIRKNARTLKFVKVVDFVMVGPDEIDQAEFDLAMYHNYHTDNDEESGPLFENLETSQIESFDLEDSDVRYYSYHGFSRVTDIITLPNNIRYLKLLSTLVLEDFCRQNFADLETVQEFKFAGVPWFIVESEEYYFLTKDQLRDMILWLPNLKKLELSRFPVLDVDNDVNLPSIPEDTIVWIKETTGLQTEREIGPFDPSPPDDDYEITIMIDPKFRLQSQQATKSTPQLSCPSL